MHPPIIFPPLILFFFFNIYRFIYKNTGKEEGGRRKEDEASRIKSPMRRRVWQFVDRAFVGEKISD